MRLMAKIVLCFGACLLAIYGGSALGQAPPLAQCAVSSKCGPYQCKGITNSVGCKFDSGSAAQACVGQTPLTQDECWMPAGSGSFKCTGKDANKMACEATYSTCSLITPCPR